MSSMLKKTGGLSFKPKVPGRRPGTGAGARTGTAPPSQPPASSASTTTTRAPTAETSSENPTPAPSAPPPTASVESPSHGVRVTPKEPQKETAKQKAPVEKPAIQTQPTAAVQPTPEPTIPPPTTSASVPIEAPPPPPSSASTSTPAPAEQAIPATPTPETITARDRPTANIDQSPIAKTPAAPPATAQRNSAPKLPTPKPSGRTRSAAKPSTAAPSSTPVPETTNVEPSDEPANTVAKRKKLSRKRKPTTTDDDVVTGSSAPKRIRFRRKAPATTEEDAEGAETRETEEAGEGGTSQVKRSFRRRRRSPTPEDAETQTVDHKTMKVGDLTKDLGIGKKFKHADAIAERARQHRAAYRLKRLEKQKRALGFVADGEDSASRAGTPAEGQEGRGGPNAAKSGEGVGAAATTQSVGYEVVNGQIIINQQSLMVDRHAAHRDNMSSLETVEEDEFTHLTTSASYMRESRRTGPNHWTDDDTEKFYRYLKMFGTDFESIASMFPHKTRRAVKLKFNREEAARPRRVDAAVMVRGAKPVAIDIEEYKSFQHQWQAPDAIMADHAKLVAEHEDDLQRLRADRRAAGLLDEEEEGAGGTNGETGERSLRTPAPDTDDVAAEAEAQQGEAVPA